MIELGEVGSVSSDQVLPLLVAFVVAITPVGSLLAEVENSAQQSEVEAQLISWTQATDDGSVDEDQLAPAFVV